MTRRWPALAAAGAMIALVTWAFVARYGFLTSSPHPLGVDGYYYPVQLRSLLDSGQLYYPSAPLGLWFMAPFAAFTDPITGAKIGTALGGALIGVPMYFLGKRVGGDRPAGLLAAVLATTSVSSIYLTSEFAKNCLGLTAAMGYLCVLGWALDAPSRRRGLAAGAAFAAVVLTHKMGAAIAVVGSIPPLWIAVRSRPSMARRVAVVGAAALAVFAVLAVLAPDRFLGGDDAGKLSALFHGTAHWKLPVLDTGRGGALLFGREVVIAAGLAVATLAVCWLARSRWRERLAGVSAAHRSFALGLAVLALVIAVPWINVSDPNGLGFRLRLIAFIPLALGAAVVVGVATSWLAPATRGALIVGIAAGWLFTRPMQATEEGVVRAHPAMISAVASMKDVVPSSDVVIVPERQVMFMVAWYADARARLSASPVPVERRWRLVTYHYAGPALKGALARVASEAPPEIVRPLGLHPFSADGLVLVPEATWRWALQRLTPEQRVRYLQWE